MTLLCYMNKHAKVQLVKTKHVTDRLRNSAIINTFSVRFSESLQKMTTERFIQRTNLAVF